VPAEVVSHNTVQVEVARVSMFGREEVIQMVAKQMYSECILNNAHRGDLVEMMVLSALGEDWRFVGLGWHPWDLQRGHGENRIRIQVRQLAALQLWGPTKKMTLQFGWKQNPPSYFRRDNPNEAIEDEGWFCELFVFGLHRVTSREKADQADPAQWEFLVVPTDDLKRGQSSMILERALLRWQPVSWSELSAEVNRCASAGD